MLAEDYNVDHSTVVRCLKKLGKVWKLAGWVVHEQLKLELFTIKEFSFFEFKLIFFTFSVEVAINSKISHTHTP